MYYVNVVLTIKTKEIRIFTIEKGILSILITVNGIELVDNCVTEKWETFGRLLTEILILDVLLW